MFKDSFKYYKARKPPPDLKDVIDVEKTDDPTVRKIAVSSECATHLKTSFGLKSTKNWNIYEFLDVPGLILIENPFTAEGQQEWILKCLKEYSKKPNILNIDAHGLLNDDETWWESCFGKSHNEDLLSKLRWATLGYHHNWDTKHYSENLRTEMPKDLTNLTNYFAEVLGFHQFKAEAAIINYYRMNSTLAGHTDHSEVFLEAPLFSISFGQTAIFLIGGHKQDDPAHALFLRSGDVVVMSGDSRLRYHGVPKILYDDSKPWNATDNSSIDRIDWQKAQSYILEARINMNVRQVLKPGQLNL
ncbi:nucleic acid dioxygenase ALKBH1 [Nasonia vitripennis]|uniref:Fe2OG dioxygenase domain-containing protein n=1 Tax=Nasonia vitripennis TaxID=7425 RepID=A0A7M7QDH3_NASVI|nr:nucleic acid dioxygenase ALKBH1 [Nasonia vitripennis]XP_031785690.1 nucleic acid dioxygenase ALKBH1 [Nasonia vitripennis]XP_032455042.1 nucleic acid dioxygenase ALKBH1 [Nasonia vitripennis]XP_032455043.1 nucleic acid dioxygenase ALKBH1 [Nasonia vitripennis]